MPSKEPNWTDQEILGQIRQTEMEFFVAPLLETMDGYLVWA